MRRKTPNTLAVAQVSGEALWTALGFRNERAFQRARQRNEIPIRVFPLPGQSRGVYARRDDLEAFLKNHPQD